MITISQRIKQRREFLKLTPEQVARKIGVNRATVYRYENNSIEKMPITVLEPIAKALETTPAYLMGWQENPDDELTYDNSKPEILALYESLPKKLQEKALAYVRAMADTYNEIKYSLNENGGIA